ncbi:MAG TPA: flagellar motor switch protein FliM [Acidimicrobiales bacterium]|nr:flagellar motor switch protein FliM [Acidimicrobiales bacterium]
MTSVAPTDEQAAEETDGREVRPYDFQRQEALERGRLRRLSPILEVMAHRIAGSLTSTLRIPVRVEIGDLEQERWEHYVNALPEPTLLTSATVTPYGGRIILHFPLAFSMTLVEIRLGGSGAGQQPERSMTEIEQRLVGEVAEHALLELPPAFAPVVTLGLGAITSVTSSLFLQASKPTEICLLAELRVDIGDVGSFKTSLCIPLTVLLPILDVLERIDRVETGVEPDSVQSDLRLKLHEVPVEVSMSFPDVVLSPDELLSLAPGDVIGLHREPGLPLLLRVGELTVGHAVATSKGKRLAGLVVENNEEMS